ncbi:ABC transporter ATP-binding protein [Mesoflavibacter sp. CH_XMU1422-2]|tara:strand:- start:1358 stop:2041 length:684 start_codon:yes stop_codon:yes gene_type:complete
MNVIEIKNLRKIYNEKTVPVNAVNDVSLSFKAKEFTAIVGASGSGKTTLLNLIGGIDTPTSGNVFINGKNVSELSENKMTQFRRDNIGFVFQQYNLLPVLTVKENVEFIMELQKKPKEEREKRVTVLLTEIGLADKINERPAKLSGGQQQRVAVARALAHKPTFVIADEPTANLDSKSTADLLNIMEELNQKEGTTFIFSTHDQRVVDRAKRVIVFEDGKVISDTSK